MNILPLHRVILAVSCASSNPEMRCAVGYICVVIGLAVHQCYVATAAESLTFIARSVSTVELPHRMLRQRITIVTVRCCCCCCRRYLPGDCNKNIMMPLSDRWTGSLYVSFSFNISVSNISVVGLLCKIAYCYYWFLLNQTIFPELLQVRLSQIFQHELLGIAGAIGLHFTGRMSFLSPKQHCVCMEESTIH